MDRERALIGLAPAGTSPGGDALAALTDEADGLRDAIARFRGEARATATARWEAAHVTLDAAIRLMLARADMALLRRGRQMRPDPDAAATEPLPAAVDAFRRRLALAAAQGPPEAAQGPARDLLARLERHF